MREINVGVIGGGNIAKAHVIAVRALRSYFGDTGYRPEVAVIADIAPEAAERAATSYGVDRWTSEWMTVIEDERIDAVTIAVPNDHHETVAVAAARAGKHVMCEKPLAHDVESARRMLEAVEEAGVIHSVDLNYRSIPAMHYARRVIREGKLGDIVGFRGAFLQDWGLDPMISRSWKFEKRRAGAGPLLSLGCHVVDLAHFLVGPISEVVATTSTRITSRPLPTSHDTYAAAAGSSPSAQVDIEDWGAFLARFENGATGVFETSRVSAGRKNHCFLEIGGTEGALVFDYENLNEILLSTSGSPGGGFTRVVIGPNEDGGLVWTLGGLGVGFAETIIVHMKEFIGAIAEGRPAVPSFADGLRAQEVIHSALVSAESGSWQGVAPVA